MGLIALVPGDLGLDAQEVIRVPAVQYGLLGRAVRASFA